MPISFPGARREFTSVHTDSREVKPGGLFFALRGASTDGHRFVEDALARGAAGVVVEHPAEQPVDAELIVVADAWAALYDLARARLEDVHPIVVGVTGSNGKTTTKELLAAALSTRYRVLKTEGNLNTETGVPLTILRLADDDQVAVLEMGMQAPGEIARLAALAQPTVGVVTGIGTVHIEFFGSQEGIALAKAELVAALPAEGVAVLNHDDPFTGLVRSQAKARSVSFGLEGGDYRGEDYAAGRFRVRGVEVRLAMPGRHQARNALAAIAAADQLGVPIADAAAALSGVVVARRLQPLPAPAGLTVVDDAYNASPESMLAAFQSVAEIPRQGRLLAVLGEMRELGGAAEREHVRIGGEADRVFDAVCVVDVGLGPVLAEAAGAELVADKPSAVAWVRGHARPGDLVLVKASHGVGLEDVVEALLEG